MKGRQDRKGKPSTTADLTRVKMSQHYALLAFALAPLIAACQLPLQPFTSSCKANDETATKDHESADEVALKFVQNASPTSVMKSI